MARNKTEPRVIKEAVTLDELRTETGILDPVAESTHRPSPRRYLAVFDEVADIQTSKPFPGSHRP